MSTVNTHISIEGELSADGSPLISTQPKREECLPKHRVTEGVRQVAKFSSLVSKRPMAKRMWLDDGILRKEVRHPPKHFKHAPVEISSIEDLVDAFMRADSKTVFTIGLHQAEYGEDVRRNKVEFGLDHGAGVMFVDNDTHFGGDQFSSLYEFACPALSAASYVHSPSSGAYIYGANGGELVGAKGQHYAVPVLDAADVPRALVALHERCILAGLGDTFISSNGLVRIKSPVDTAMATVQQPLFQGVDTEDGMEQRKKDFISFRVGEVFLFDTRLIHSMTPTERVQLQAIENILRQHVEEEAARSRERWLSDRVDDVSIANGVSLGEARTKLEETLRASAGKGGNVELCAGSKINFDKLGRVDVTDVLADPEKFHGQTCDDPLEPDYKPGTQVAICYCKSKDGKPHEHPGIHSFAHGLKTIYHLKRDLRHVAIDLDAIRMAQDARSETGQGVSGSSTSEVFHDGEVLLPEIPSDLAGFHILEMPSAIRATEFVVDGFLPTGVTVIAGEPGVGKTTNLVPVAASVAHLTPAEWRFHPKRRRVVVWLSEHPEQVFDTIEALLRLDDAASRDEFADWFKVVSTRRSNPEELAQLIEAVNVRFRWVNDRGAAVQPLIVWDTAAATIDVENENDNSIISKAIALAKQALDGGALWVITHTPKANRNASDVSQMSARGGSAYEGDANCTAYLFRGREGYRVLALGKIRFEPEFTEIHFEEVRRTEIIVDEFDGEEIEKSIISGLPLRGSKLGRQQETKNLYRKAQRDAIMEAAVDAAKAGAICSGNDLIKRVTIAIQRKVSVALIELMISDGVLYRVAIPRELHKKLQLNSNKTHAILPASANQDTVFALAMGGGVGSHGLEHQGLDFVKSEGGDG